MSENQISDADVFRLIEAKNWDIIIALLDQGKLNPNKKLVKQFFAERLNHFLLPMMVEDKANRVVQKLLEKGANPNQRNDSLHCLSLAVELGNREALEMLLNAGADLETTARQSEDGGGETALMLAAHEHNLWAVERLIEAGADPAKVTKKRQTGIWFVCREDYQKRFEERSNIIRKLINAGCKLLGTELHWPVYHRDVELVALLLNLGCPVNEPFSHNEFDGPRKGDTPLTLAVETSVGDMADSMLNASISAKAKAEIINRLLSSKANPNIPNGKGQTPLLLALIGNDLETTKKLLVAGGDRYLCPPNSKMGSAMDYAKEHELAHFIALFG